MRRSSLEKEGNAPDPSIFAHVVYLAAGALLAIIIAAVIIISWRAHKKNKAPFNKHPVSQLMVPRQVSRAA